MCVCSVNMLHHVEASLTGRDASLSSSSSSLPLFYFYIMSTASPSVLSSGQTHFYIIEEASCSQSGANVSTRQHPRLLSFFFSISHCPLFDSPHRTAALALQHAMLQTVRTVGEANQLTVQQPTTEMEQTSGVLVTYLKWRNNVQQAA